MNRLPRLRWPVAPFVSSHPFFLAQFGIKGLLLEDIGGFLGDILGEFMGISSANPHSPTWVTKGFKGFIAHAKCDFDSHESELSS